MKKLNCIDCEQQMENLEVESSFLVPRIFTRSWKEVWVFYPVCFEHAKDVAVIKVDENEVPPIIDLKGEITAGVRTWLRIRSEKDGDG